MYKLPELDYPYDALAPHISKNIMELHHDKHHQTYVDKLNGALEQLPDWQGKDISELLRRLDSIPDNVRLVVKNNGGGHYNHSLFWKIMSPSGGGQPGGSLANDLNTKYSDFQHFIDEFSSKALSVFGSGWVWLMPDLGIMTTPNQDSPLMSNQPEPILGLDVWEHAYYLDYTYKRADYVKAWWNVINWPEAERRYGA